MSETEHTPSMSNLDAYKDLFPDLTDKTPQEAYDAVLNTLLTDDIAKSVIHESQAPGIAIQFVRSQFPGVLLVLEDDIAPEAEGRA